MPEGPEVKVIVDGLNSVLKNKYIVDINLTKTGRYRNKAPNGFKDFKSFVTKKKPKIEKILVKGKFIYFLINNGWYIFNQLGMSGIWSHQPQKHTCLILTYTQSNPNNIIANIFNSNLKKLYFIDQRHFGIFEFTNKKSILNQKLNSIGPDLLNQKVTIQQFKNILNNHLNKNICKVLMDQKIISGIGNYLKSEILYESKLHPLLTIKQLTSKEINNLLKASQRLIKASYNAQGNSLRHYKNVESEKGTFEFQLKVYGRKKDPFGNPVKRIKTPDNRSTFFVENIQTL